MKFTSGLLPWTKQPRYWTGLVARSLFGREKGLRGSISSKTNYDSSLGMEYSETSWDVTQGLNQA